MPTITRYLDGLGAGSPVDLEKVSRWAPDVFALTASLLRASGAYTAVLRSWPPSKPLFGSRDRWRRQLSETAESWRRAMDANDVFGPVRDALRALASDSTTLGALSSETARAHGALELLSLSDEACVGIGVTRPTRAFEIRAEQLLLGTTRLGSSLCSDALDHELVRVLPKQHTPVSGMTLRSLSHHLALHSGSEVIPHWRGMPTAPTRGCFNILLAPWPLSLHRTQFEEKVGTLHEMPDRFGFMTVRESPQQLPVEKWLAELLVAARAEVGPIHAVVLPECSLSRVELERVVASPPFVEPDAPLLIAGVLERRKPYSVNAVTIRSMAMQFEQAKHHRWKLDRSQIEQYGLAGRLNPAMEWWEDSEVAGREINFVALSDELTMCCLVCEDLARQDPVASLVRSVGPSLVVALLMDAPQVSRRWPARYATVLADDPGSSVLTLTSWGMASMATPPSGQVSSRAVALWKDAHTGLREIDLPVGSDGVVLSLFTENRTEYSADGRGDGGMAPYPRLGGVLPIRSVAQGNGQH